MARRLSHATGKPCPKFEPPKLDGQTDGQRYVEFETYFYLLTCDIDISLTAGACRSCLLSRSGIVSKRLNIIIIFSSAYIVAQSFKFSQNLITSLRNSDELSPYAVVTWCSGKFGAGRTLGGSLFPSAPHPSLPLHPLRSPSFLSPSPPFRYK